MKRKYTLSTILIFGFLLYIGFPPHPLYAYDTDRYTNNEYGFSVDHPASWVVIEEGEGGIIIATDSSFRDATEDVGAGFGVMRLPDQFMQSPEIIDIWEEMTKDMEIDAGTPQSIEVEGAVGLYSPLNEDPDKDMSGGVYLFLAGEKAYMVVTVIHPASELAGEYQAVLEEMIATLEFHQ